MLHILSFRTLLVLSVANLLVSLSYVKAVNKGDNVIEITAETWKDYMWRWDDIESVGWSLPNQNTVESYFLMEFYSPICGIVLNIGHCISFAPEYARIGDYLSGVLRVARMSTDVSAHEPFLKRFNIEGTPTILLFIPGNATPVEYSGTRTAVAIVKWISSQLSTPLTLAPDTFSSFIHPQSQKIFPTRLVLAYKGEEIPEVYKTLFTAKKSTAFFATFQVSVAKLEAEGVNSFPALLVLHTQRHKISNHQNSGNSVETFSRNWEESLTSIWKDIDHEDLIQLQNQTPLVSLMVFLLLFGGIFICVAISVYLCLYDSHNIEVSAFVL